MTHRQDRRQESTAMPPAAQIKTGLRRKFFVAITLLISFMSAVFFLFFFHEAKKLLTSEFEKRSFGLATNLARNIEPDLVRAAPQAMEAIIQNLLDVKDVVYVMVLNPKGGTIISRAASGVSLPRPLTRAEQAKRSQWQHPMVLPGTGSVQEFVFPILTIRQVVQSSPREPALNRGLSDAEIHQILTPDKIQLERIGIVRLGMSTSSIQKELRSKSFVMAGFFILFLVLGGALSLVLSRLIVDPIQRLVRAMKLVACQDEECQANGVPMARRFRRVSDVELSIHSQDEIEQLADEFRAMVGKLEKSYENLETIIEEKSQIALDKSELAESLKELNRQNEALIKERTREVVEKNLRLYEISEELQFQKEELISMNEQLEKTSRMKSEFLASMSHELRTPLNSIIGFAEVLKDKMFGELNERQEKYLTNILASGRHLLELINNILDISKVEAGKMKLMIEPYSINRVIDEVQNIIRTLAYKKNIEVQMQLGPDVVMHGDVAKFKQILYNLLSNAIKFTDERGLVVITTQEIKPGSVYKIGTPMNEHYSVNADSILLTVRDTGIGIKPEDMQRIFIEFEQTDQTRRKRYEGTGLGLALTKKLTILHGGKIWVESEVGKGTQIFVILPLTAQMDEDDTSQKKDDA